MDNIIFLNHKQKQCGVYQYGYRSGLILKKSQMYNFVYVEVESESEFVSAVDTYKPIAIIYNYHPATMGWLGHCGMKRFPHIIQCGLYHEGTALNTKQFHQILFVDSTHVDTKDSFGIPRPLFETNFNYEKPTIPVISSFGFGFEHKGFEKIVRLVNEQFDEAIIRLHIPYAFYADRDGTRAAGVIARCQQEMKKSNIKLIATHNFLTDEELLKFLSTSTINMFLYDNITGILCGLSSVIDYALSVNVPFAISNSNMFRHILSDSICVDNQSINDIINSGNHNMDVYKEKWSHNNFIKKYESIISGYSVI